MAGYSKIYCMGGLGGFMGADGINPIGFQILVGDGGRQWLEVHYFDPEIKPIGKINVIIPEGHHTALLDACIAFAPRFFEDCPSLSKVKAALADAERLDFDMDKKDIPAAWFDLRKEALPYFKQLNLFEARLEWMDLEDYSI